MSSIDWAAVIEALSSGGADLAEAYVERLTTTTIVGEEGRIEKVLVGQDLGVCLRRLEGGRTALAYTNDLNQPALMDLARLVAAGVAGSPAGPVKIGPAQEGRGFPIRLNPRDVAARQKVEVVFEAMAAARDLDPRVKQVRVTYGDRAQEVRIVNSEGVHVVDRRLGTIMAVQAVAEARGVIETGLETAGGFIGFELFEDRPAADVARTAARRAVTMLEADPAPSGPMPVVLWSSAGGTMVHEAVGHGLEADLAGEGLSVYSGRLGEKVASDLVTVIDDATMPHRRGSFSFDDEGHPAQRTVLVDRGMLTSYMVDRLSAQRYGLTPTGNGRRESYRHKPICRMTNTIIAPGKDDPAAILKSTPRGLLVKKMGGGQVNTVNGDFVFEVSEGYLIENGRQGRPVRGATLTGNGPAVLQSIDRVASDLGFSIGTCGKDGQGAPVADAQPTLRIPELVVGGTAGA